MMSFVLSNTSNTRREVLEADYYIARCYGVIITGTTFNQRFGNTQTKVTFLWELPSELINYEKDGQTITAPKVISKSFTLSMNERATLRKNLESWIDRAFTPEELKQGVDISKFAGTACRLAIGQAQKVDGTKYNTVDKVVRLKDGKCPSLFNDKILFDITDENQDLDEINKLPGWIQDTVRKSDEWQRRMYPEDYATEDASQYDDDVVEFKDEDIPF